MATRHFTSKESSRVRAVASRITQGAINPEAKIFPLSAAARSVLPRREPLRTSLRIQAFADGFKNSTR